MLILHAVGCLLPICLVAADEPRLEQHAYVWQRHWGEPVALAIARAAPEMDAFAVLAGECGVDRHGKLTVRPGGVEWPPLSAAKRPVWLTFRLNTRVADLLETAGSRAEVGRKIAELTDQLRLEAGAAVIAGVQLDYDCPTAMLSDYRDLLVDLKRRLDLPLSITSLPAWLDSQDLPAVLEPLAFHVLQVHSLERPTTLDQPARLIPSDRLPAWLERAGRLDTPYLVALPTYGYLLQYGADGRFQSLVAEGMTDRVAPGGHVRLVLADPDEEAALVRAWLASPPAGCRGLVWFRLPVDTDRLNWSWQALRAVMAGKSPTVAAAAEFRRHAAGSHDLWLVNTGERNVPGAHVRIVLGLAGTRVAGFDLVGGARLLDTSDDTAIHIQAPAPILDEPRCIGWFRFDAEPAPILRVSVVNEPASRAAHPD